MTISFSVILHSLMNSFVGSRRMYSEWFDVSQELSVLGVTVAETDLN